MKSGIHLIEEMNQCVVGKGKIAFWWLGQLGYACKIGTTIVYIDAYLAENPDRTIPPLLKPEEVTNADLVIGSHDHEDHIDRSSWHTISKHSNNVKFIVPELFVESVSAECNIHKDRLIGFDNGKKIAIHNLHIEGIASAHEFLDQDEKTGCYPYLGFVIEGNGCRLYHSGDCCIYPGLLEKLKELGPYEVIFLPINGRDAKRYASGIIGNMTYQEAVDFAGYLQPGLVVPGHYEMFAMNQENPKLFADYLKAKYPNLHGWIGEHGEMVTVRKWTL